MVGLQGTERLWNSSKNGRRDSIGHDQGTCVPGLFHTRGHLVWYLLHDGSTPFPLASS
jgi:hypothetical protein